MEVNEYFRNRAWFDPGKQTARPPTYQFGTARDVVGYLAMAFGNKPHPNESSTSTARYLVFYALGIGESFQGRTNPYSPTGERYAETVVRAMEFYFATQKKACVGLYLRVRETNARAVAFYRRLGFREDPGTAVVVDDAAPQIIRKLFDQPT